MLLLLWTVRWWAKSGEKRREHRPDVLRARGDDGGSRIVTLRINDSVNRRVETESQKLVRTIEC